MSTAPGQKPGCGYPVMGVAGLLYLSHGGWEEIMPCDFREHDARVAPRFLDHMGQGELLLAGGAYCSYQFFFQPRDRKAQVIVRLHQVRHRMLDWRRGKRLGKDQRLVTWTKPLKKPTSNELSDAQWEEIHEELEGRLIEKKVRNRQGKMRSLVVVTTLLDHERYPAEDVIDPSARHWGIEVQLRDVKTTLKTESFAVRTPEMANKTLVVMTNASNLLRALFAAKRTRGWLASLAHELQGHS
ncbi:MAG: transposase [Verrucomicrobiota bacterium]